MSCELVFREEEGSEDYPLACCAIASLRWFPEDDEDHSTRLAELPEIVEEHCQAAREEGKSLAIATLNTEQTKAAAILEALGFVCPQDDWAYRDPKVSNNKAGVKVFVKVLL